MSVTYIKRIEGSTNNVVFLWSSDSTATCTGADYLTAQAANIAALNFSETSNPFQWFTNDLVILSASDGLSLCSINSSFTTLTAISSQATSSAILYNNVVNTMAAGGQIKLDKGTGTVNTGAVTINKQAGVITTTSLTTAAGATTSITFTNSEIASSSVVLVSLMGGTNTTLGVQLSATAGSGTSTITIGNNNATDPLNGTLLIGFVVL